MGNMMEQRADFKSMTESTEADRDVIAARHQPFAAPRNSIYRDARNK